MFQDKNSQLYNIINKRVVSDEAKKDILGVVERGDNKKTLFVENRIRDEKKHMGQNDESEISKLGKSQEFHLKASTSLLKRLFVIATYCDVKVCNDKSY